MTAETEYEPFGDQWEKEMLKLPKAMIITIAANLGKEKSALELSHTMTAEEIEHTLKHGPMFIDTVRPILEGFAKKQVMISKAAELLNIIAREYAAIQAAAAFDAGVAFDLHSIGGGNSTPNKEQYLKSIK